HPRPFGRFLLSLPRPPSSSTLFPYTTLFRSLDIGFWDERLSTVAAERALLEADTSRKRRAEVIDHVAAGFILQGALDRIGHLGQDRKSTRLNSSHVKISYAVFCLKKKNSTEA